MESIYRPKTVTFLTPTADRPEAFELCRYWMHGMEMNGMSTQWLVVDDGITPVATSMAHTTIRRDPKLSREERREMSMPLNLLSAVPRIIGDVVILIEDDNFYHHEYLRVCLQALGNADVVGPRLSRYYHLGENAHFTYEHPVCATLGETAFRRSFLPEFVDACVWALDNKQKDVDVLLWTRTRDAGRATYRYPNEEKCYSLGIKGMPGRGGLGAGHKVGDDWSRDPDRQQLREWIGPKKAARYSNIGPAAQGDFS